MKIIAISNQKGGVGKTTTATALAYGLKKRGKKVLLVDCDSQSNSTSYYHASSEDGYPTLSDFLYTDEPATECIQHTDVGDILAADDLLDDAELHLKGVSGFYRLKNRLSELEGLYDHIILDTPPNLGILLQNALIAAQGVIVPVPCEEFAVQGMAKFSGTVSEVKAQANPDLRVLGLLLVMYDGRLVLTKEIDRGLPEIAKLLGTEVFGTRIRKTATVGKAQGTRVQLLEYDPKCTAAADYERFIDELRERGFIDG